MIAYAFHGYAKSNNAFRRIMHLEEMYLEKVDRILILISNIVKLVLKRKNVTLHINKPKVILFSELRGKDFLDKQVKVTR